MQETHHVTTVVCNAVLGYGKSVPGANDDLRASEIQQADYVNRLIDARFSEYKEIVIVARGWGVTVAIELGKVLQACTHARANLYLLDDGSLWIESN